MLYDFLLFSAIAARVIIILGLLSLVITGQAQCSHPGNVPMSVLEATLTILSDGSCTSYRNVLPQGGKHEKSDSTPFRPTEKLQ